ncbi:hypothetical protein TNCV_3371201 [Trichonephila clavipes]|nr:hypothetical protein TNCV_3371201 [Trichonephila clavipes]
MASFERKTLQVQSHWDSEAWKTKAEMGRLSGIRLWDYKRDNLENKKKIPWQMRSQVAVRNNISKRGNTTENDVSKNQSSADSAIRLPNTSILNSNVADATEYLLDVPNYNILNIL